MHWLHLADYFPLELVDYVFSFFSIRHDMVFLKFIISEPDIPQPMKWVAYRKLLKFVVIDPSCWTKEFTRMDYWFPTINEFNSLLAYNRKPPVPSTIQLCIYHDYSKHQLEIYNLILNLAQYKSFQFQIYFKGSLYEVDQFKASLESYTLNITKLVLVTTEGQEISCLNNTLYEKCQFPCIKYLS